MAELSDGGRLEAALLDALARRGEGEPVTDSWLERRCPGRTVELRGLLDAYGALESSAAFDDDGEPLPFDVERRIGRGGMGTVYLARLITDQTYGRCGDAVAVKVVHPHLLATPQVAERFRREALVGRSIEHPNLVRTYALGTTRVEGEELHHLVMEYVPGASLRQLLAEQGRVSEELCLLIAREVASGLAAMHAGQVVHRDLKPENVLLTADHRVKISDLGAALLVGEAIRLSEAGQFLGSVLYAAPEQFERSDAARDPRVDLYALGTTLFELAAGEHPFAGDDLRVVLQRKLSEPARRVGLGNPQLSPFFEEVIATCLERDPGLRFTSAAELLEVLESGESGAWWRERVRERQELGVRPRVVRVLRDAPLTGRSREFRELVSGWFEATQGQTQLYLVSGELGAGKSRLVEEFVAHVQRARPDASVLCASRRPRVDDAVLGPWLPALRASLADAGETAPRGRVAGSVPGAPTGPEQALRTLVELVGRAATDGPLALVLDDAHTMPSATLAALPRLAAEVDGAPVLVLLTADTGAEHDAVTAISTHPRTRVVRLDRLCADSSAALVRATIAPRRPARETVERIVARAGGNALFLVELARAARQTEPTAPPQTDDLPAAVRVLVHARLCALAEEDRELLELAACAGAEFEPVLLADALGQPRIPVLRRLGALERRHRIVHATGRRFAFDHGLLREGLLDSVAPALRREYHGALARALARGPDSDAANAAVIVHHYLRAGRPESAQPHLDAALSYLQPRHANEEVLELVREVLAAPGAVAGERRVQLLIEACERLDRLGRGTEQEPLLGEARDIAESGCSLATQARVLAVTGRLRTLSGRFDDAHALLEDALARARRSGAEPVIGGVIGNLAIVADSLGRTTEARTWFEQALELARRNGDPGRVAAALTNLALSLTRLGETRRAAALLEEAVSVARSTGDDHTLACALGAQGAVARARGRLSAALRRFEEAAEVHRVRGDQYGLATGLLDVAELRIALGDERGARRHLAHVRVLLGGEATGLPRVALLTALAELADRRGAHRRATALCDQAVAAARGAATRAATARALFLRGRRRAEQGETLRARDDLREAVRLAVAADEMSTAVVAAAHLSRVVPGVAEFARRRLETERRRVAARDLIDARHALWLSERRPADLQDARESLATLVAHAPEQDRTNLIERVPLHRAIRRP